MFTNALATALLSLALSASAAPLPTPMPHGDLFSLPSTLPEPETLARRFNLSDIGGDLEDGAGIAAGIGGLAKGLHKLHLRDDAAAETDAPLTSETFARRFNLSDIGGDLEDGAGIAAGIGGLAKGLHKFHLRDDVAQPSDVPGIIDNPENGLETFRIGTVNLPGEHLPTVRLREDLQARQVNASDVVGAVEDGATAYSAVKTAGGLLHDIGKIAKKIHLRDVLQTRQVNTSDILGAVEDGTDAYSVGKTAGGLLHDIGKLAGKIHLRDNLVQELHESGQAAVGSASAEPPADAARLAGELQTLPHISNMLRRAADGDEDAVTNIVRALMAAHLQASQGEDVEAGEPQLF